MPARSPDLCRNRCLNGLDELPGGLVRLLLALPHDVLCDILCEAVLPVIADDAVKLHFAVIVYNVRRSLRISLVHTHVQRCILPVGKPSGCCIQLVRGNTKIQINAVHLFNAKVMKHRSNVFIIAPHYGNLVLKLGKTRRCSCDRICVLVDADEASVLP